MAKRFTDTNKWRKAWYRKFGSEKRDLWNYLHDNCDHAGLFEIDLEAMTFDLGFEITIDMIKEVLRDKYMMVGEDKIFLHDFIEFQYGELREDCKPHAAVIKMLKKEAVWEGYVYSMDTVMDKDKEKDQDKDKDPPVEKFEPDLEAIYKLYPRKEGKAQGLKKLKADIKTPELEQKCLLALNNFINHHRSLGTDPKYMPHFKTWATSWTDCLEEDYGKTSLNLGKNVTAAFGLAKL